MLSSFLYGPFGEVVHMSGNSDQGRNFNYKDNDSLTGLRYYGFRYYDPHILRWNSSDPLYKFMPDLGLGTPQRLNLYTFSLNNPLKYFDPDGRDSGNSLADAGPTDAGTIDTSLPLCGDVAGPVKCLDNQEWAEWCEANPDECHRGWNAFKSGLSTAGVFVAFTALSISCPKCAFAIAMATASNEEDAAKVAAAALAGAVVSKGIGAGVKKVKGRTGTPTLAPGRVFENQLPERYAAEVAAARQVGAVPIQAGAEGFEAAVNQGTLKFVVTEAGELVVSPAYVRGVEISHAVLSGGRPVLTAGQAEIAAVGGRFQGLFITNHSGHFQPSQESIGIAQRLFANLGITF